LLRNALGTVLPRRWLLRPLLQIAYHAKDLARLLPPTLRRAAQVALRLPKPPRSRAVSRHHAAESKTAKRVALHIGCVQEAIAPRITAAAIRALTRHGFDVTTVQGSGCCGSLNHHLGQGAAADRHATALIGDVEKVEGAARFDAIVTTASGCASTMRDYGFQLHDEQGAVSFAARVRDIADILRDAQPQAGHAHEGVRVAYHAACSLTHGLKQPRVAPDLLRALGFDIVEPRDTNCCGSAGVYNILEPQIADQLQQRKADALMALTPAVIATGNIGCLAQIAAAVPVPVVHTVELIDWATGGPSPLRSSAE
jgi:glycolate oxidase iron-sulfur subunit